MIFATATNSCMQFIFVIIVLLFVGDYDRISTSTLPILDIYYAATGSKAAATVLLVLFHATIFTVSLLNIFASVSRLVWAFARDKGLPFHHLFTYVHPTLQIPIPALALTSIVCAVLALINIGSTVAFTALVSLPTVAIYISYFIPIFLLTLRKLQGQHPRYGPFTLGRWGLPINIFSLCYILYMLCWLPFPPERPVTTKNMNYAGPITLGVVVIALLDWVTTGRKRFTVPTGGLVDE